MRLLRHCLQQADDLSRAKSTATDSPTTAPPPRIRLSAQQQHGFYFHLRPRSATCVVPVGYAANEQAVEIADPSVAGSATLREAHDTGAREGHHKSVEICSGLHKYH